MNNRRMQTSISALAACVASLAIFAAVAVAATITGTDLSENLHGTHAADGIDAMAGDDRVIAKRGADTVNGGLGNDRIWGNQGADVLNGDDGDDRMHGGYGNDTQNGGPGNDLIFAGVGVDTTYGGDGNDTLWALARADVRGHRHARHARVSHRRIDTVGDTLDGGNGDDTFRTRDGEVDSITCGEGNDTAYLDFRDRIADATEAAPNGSCETVVRRSRNHRDNQETSETVD